MVSISKIFGYTNKLFTKNSTQVAKSAPKFEPPKTEVLTDLLSGTQTLKREINYAGKKATATVETKTLENGAKQTRLSIEGGGDNPIWRTKTITREKGTSVYGGDKITIDTNYTKYWCHGEDSKLIKEYNPQRTLEHTDLKYHKNIGNETHIKHTATQDRIYSEVLPTHSAKKMLEDPHKSDKVMHAVDNQNNYNKFQTTETPYEKNIRVKKEQAIAEANKAEEAKKAAELAAQKAAAELESKMPRINTSKILGLNANELKMVEKVHDDGSVTRYFFYPETGVGKRKPIIKTYDKGILHQEWIGKTSKADKIYIKQVGKDKPYIIAQKGNYTQIGEKQYYYNGEISYINEIGDLVPFNSSYSYGKIRVKMPYQKSPNGIERKEMGYIKGDLDTIAYDASCGRTSKDNIIVKEMYNTHQKEYIDLNDLLKPYEK